MSKRVHVTRGGTRSLTNTVASRSSPLLSSSAVSTPLSILSVVSRDTRTCTSDVHSNLVLPEESPPHRTQPITSHSSSSGSLTYLFPRRDHFPYRTHFRTSTLRYHTESFTVWSDTPYLLPVSGTHGSDPVTPRYLLKSRLLLTPVTSSPSHPYPVTRPQHRSPV